jgi:hypothetical protein
MRPAHSRAESSRGNPSTYKYALRCTNEDHLIDRPREILPLIGKQARPQAADGR